MYIGSVVKSHEVETFCMMKENSLFLVEKICSCYHYIVEDLT